MDFEKKNSIYKSIMIVIVTVIITYLITAISLYNYFVKTKDGLVKTLITTETTAVDTKIQLVREYLNKLYLGDISDEEKLIESAVKGYVAGLGDEYTEYLTKEEYEELMIDVNGDYVGIGIYMTQDRYGNIIVLLPIEGSPAEEGGIKTGDIITKINGEDCTEMELSAVANKVKGEEGTTVDIEIQREGETINKTIQRRTVEINHIEAEIMEQNIGYMEILSFDDECSKNFETKLEELKSKDIKSLIIDLRDNGGGIVDEAINIAELFVPKDKVIMKEISKNNKEKQVTAKKNINTNTDINVIVLTNENTASASEILVGALKDNNIAKIVGSKTYGKGVMQEIVPVSSGGALKVTIQEFYTPNGDKINKTGIVPDVEVKDNLETEKDEQLQKAIEMCK